MNALPIYTYDHPILRKKLSPVREIDDAIVQLALLMHSTMRNADGIGLAANQVGRDVTMAVVDISGVKGFEGIQPLTLINPVIEASSEEEESQEEGCLSLPQIRAEVIRPSAVQLRFYDLEMNEHVMEVDELLARVVQHEIDHLNGLYFFDRVSPMRRTMMKRKLLDIKRGDFDTDYPIFGRQEQKQ